MSLDSDAEFRSVDLSVWMHLNHLSIRRIIGFLGNAPYDAEPNAGYWFVKRGREVAEPQLGKRRSTGADFIRAWWDQDWLTMAWEAMEEQGTLRRMTGYGESDSGES